MLYFHIMIQVNLKSKFEKLLHQLTCRPYNNINCADDISIKRFKTIHEKLNRLAGFIDNQKDKDVELLCDYIEKYVYYSDKTFRDHQKNGRKFDTELKMVLNNFYQTLTLRG